MNRILRFWNENDYAWRFALPKSKFNSIEWTELRMENWERNGNIFKWFSFLSKNVWCLCLPFNSVSITIKHLKKLALPLIRMCLLFNLSLLLLMLLFCVCLFSFSCILSQSSFFRFSFSISDVSHFNFIQSNKKLASRLNATEAFRILRIAKQSLRHLISHIWSYSFHAITLTQLFVDDDMVLSNTQIQNARQFTYMCHGRMTHQSIQHSITFQFHLIEGFEQHFPSESV